MTKETMKQFIGNERHIQTALIAVTTLILTFMYNEMSKQTEQNRELREAYSVMSSLYSEQQQSIARLSSQVETLQSSVQLLHNRLEGYSAVRQRLNAVEAKAEDFETRLRSLEQRRE